jgi:hypothetical protein
MISRVPHAAHARGGAAPPARHTHVSCACCRGVADVHENDVRALSDRVYKNAHGLSKTSALFINIAVLLWAAKFERKRDASGRLLPLDLDGWVDVGLSMLAEFIACHYVDANVRNSTDVQSPLKLRSLRASQRQLRCLHRNVSCAGCEHEVD